MQKIIDTLRVSFHHSQPYHQIVLGRWVVKKVLKPEIQKCFLKLEEHQMGFVSLKHCENQRKL